MTSRMHHVEHGSGAASIVFLHGGGLSSRQWQPPRLRLFEDVQRRATWLELVYDLVFVVAVAELAGVLAAGPDAGGVLTFVGLFVPIWWAWAGYVFYANRFDTDDVSHRLLAVPVQRRFTWRRPKAMARSKAKRLSAELLLACTSTCAASFCR